jgi:hypothetical protein
MLLSLVPSGWLTIRRLAPYGGPISGAGRLVIENGFGSRRLNRPTGAGGRSGAEDASPALPGSCRPRWWETATIYTVAAGRTGCSIRAKLAKPPGTDVHIRESTTRPSGAFTVADQLLAKPGPGCPQKALSSADTGLWLLSVSGGQDIVPAGFACARIGVSAQPQQGQAGQRQSDHEA